MTGRDLLAFMLSFGFVSFILFFLIYGLTSLCYQKIFRAYGYSHPGYAWIPFYRLYILADLTCGPIFKLGDFEIEKKIFVWWWIIVWCIAFVPLVGGFLSFILQVLCLGYCHHEGIKKVDPTYDSVVLSYVSAIFSIFLWFLVLPKKTNY